MTCSGGLFELAKKNPDSPDLFFAGMAHYYGAKTFRASYSAGEQERASPAQLNEECLRGGQILRNGIQAFRSSARLMAWSSATGRLIDGLLHCLMSKRDPAGIVAAENDLLNAIGEYRKLCPAGKNRESLFKLLFIQASLAQKEGTRLALQEYNSLASQAFFKKSRGNLVCGAQTGGWYGGHIAPGGRL